MASQWQSFEPTQFFPVPLQRAVSALDAAFRTTRQATSLLDKALKIAAQVSRSVSSNPVEVALRTATQQIDEFLGGVMGNTQCHAILIPIRKRSQRRAAQHMSRLDDFLTPVEPAYIFVQDAMTSTAGPKMFFRTLVESVADAGDINRPDFPSNYSVAGACVLAGAETLSDLQIPFRLFMTLFVGNQRLAPNANLFPVVQNLRVMPAALRGGTGVMLSWDPLPPITNSPLFTDEVIVAKEIFLIRTTRPFQQGFLSWDDLFAASQPHEDPTDLQSKDGSVVIARLQNHGFVRSYTDTENLLDPLKTYYYTACVRYTLNGVVQPMGALSNVVRVARMRPLPSSRRAVPPDWIATPTIARMFPPLYQSINAVRLAISKLGAYTVSNTGGQQMLDQTISQLDRLAHQWDATLAEIESVTGRLQAITASGTPSGMYSTLITTTDGGIDGWLAELSRRLSDTSDPSRPELSDQSSVIGFVILAGAPRLPDLAGTIALLRLFFGGPGKSPLYDVLRQMDGHPPAPVVAPAASARILGYDDALKPSTTPTC
jgi:hypothetical protein